MDSAATFGEILRQYRQGARLTQAELAERAGLSEREISDLERGLTKRPQRGTIHLLATALGLAPKEAEKFQLTVRSRPADDGATNRGLASHNLPAALTSFIGREDELTRLHRLLEPDTSQTRLVTLTGEGGCGKTRLAVQVALGVADYFPDGIYFVDLSGIVDTRLVSSAVVGALSGQEAPELTPFESLLRRVRGRRLLLLVDNCEHLLLASAELVQQLLSRAPEVRILATSREALRVPGEIAWRVRSLHTPNVSGSLEADHMLEYEAVQLFVDRSLQVKPDFHITGSNAAAVADICRRLDGIPLALELAAARGAAMSVQEIAARLHDCFALLTGGSRTALRRQRTLRATIDWSHDLLSPSEQVLFRRLAVFAGGWTLEAAEAVCAGDPLRRSDVLAVLMRLIDQSLVSAHIQDGPTRYRFLETVRSYAAERLHAAGELQSVQARHRDWCLKFAERAADSLIGPDGATWFQLMTVEHENVRTALDACGTDGSATDAQLRLVAAMCQFWFPRQPSEGRRRLAEALERAAPTPSAAHATALIWQATVDVQFGDGASARALARAALTEARAIGDARRAAEALWVLVLASEENDSATRVASLEEGLMLARAAGLKGLQARHLAFLGAAAADAGELRRARILLEECDVLARSAGDAWSRMTTITQLGWLAIAEGRLDNAESHFQTLLDLGTGWAGYHDVPGLIGLGQVALRRGDLQHARTLYRRLMMDVRESAPGSIVLAIALVYMASVDAVAGLDERAQRLMGASDAWHTARDGTWTWAANLRGPLTRGLVPIPTRPTDARLTQARAVGQGMSLADAVTYALESVEASEEAASRVARTSMEGATAGK
jgi:predicted ATPase/DNA-binding XRE family transcriptional regulator